MTTARKRRAGASFDESDHRTWSTEHYEMDVQAWFGLMNNNLEPLLAYLRSEYPLSRQIRNSLADCIEGDDTLYTVKLKKRRGGPGNPAQTMEIHSTKIAICEIVDVLISGPGTVDAAIAEASELFGVSPATVTNARRWAKDVKAGRGAPAGFAMTGWSKDSAE